MSNLKDASHLATQPESVTRVADSMLSCNFQVKSQSGRAQPYLVRLAKKSMVALETSVRDMVSCGCPGYTLALAGSDRVCKHCGAILLLCLRAHRAAPVFPLRALPDASTRPASGSLALADAGVCIRADGGTRPATGSNIRAGGREILSIADRGQWDGMGQWPMSWQRMVQHNENVDRRAQRKEGVDSQSSVPRLEPVADAVQQRSKPSKAGLSESELLFEGYQESDDDASHLMLGGGGTVLSVMSSKQAQKMGAYLIGKAVSRIVLTAYTYDLVVITNALKEAAIRGVTVTVIGDHGHTLTGATAAMVERFTELKDAGVTVLLTRGVSGGSGIQHSKTLLCDVHAIVGSCNWTNSSRSNQETSVLLFLNEPGLAAYEDKLRYLQRHGQPFSEKDEASGRKNRESRRIQSVPPTEERYRTAKKFSIARARSAAEKF